jgi:serine/threonine protein kinase/tetratricopeptide (TPR) repeat protein
MSDGPHDETVAGSPHHARTQTGGSRSDPASPPGDLPRQPGVSAEEPSVASAHMKASLRARLFDAPASAVTIGRFRVLEEIGAGGMGRVFAAYDDQLDRRVAVKVVDRDRGGDDGHARLRREAQALGRLAHPNVVAVHEVGEHAGQVFVAMEYVLGNTLRAWIESEPRTPGEILAVYVQAGRGLEAAHVAGILHRDFKPDNVMVGDDGRVRVLDFGLARGVDGDAAAELARTRETRPAELDTSLTQTGTVMGTPSYMAAEQHQGRPVDARTDQYSFCVALWEALYREHPYGGDTYEALARNVVAGDLRQPRRTVGSARLRETLARGLAATPEARHPDMSSLVTRLERELNPRSGRPRRLAAASVLVAGVGVAAFVGLGSDRPQPLETCAATTVRLAGLWDDATRETLRAKYREDPARPFIAGSYRSFERSMNDLSDAWTSQYESACADIGATDQTVRRLAVRRLDCLDRGLSVLGVWAATAASTEPMVFARAYTGELGMRETIVCTNDAVVRSMPAAPADEAMAKRVQAIERDVQLAVAARTSGDLRVALDLAEDALRRTESVDYAPLRSEALAVLARTKLDLQHPDAEPAVAAAMRSAEASGHDIVELDILLARARTKPLDETLARLDAVVERLGSPPEAQARVALARARAAFLHGTREQGSELAREAVQAFADDERLTAVLRARVLEGIASGQFGVDDGAERVRGATRAIEILEADLGPQHPITALHRDFRAFALDGLGKTEEALAEWEELIRILGVAYPEGHKRTGWALHQKAIAQIELGQLGKAHETLLQAEAMLSATLGPTHTETVRGPTARLIQFSALTGDEAGTRRRIRDALASGSAEPSIPLYAAAVAALDGDAEGARSAIAPLVQNVGGLPPTLQQTVLIGASYVEMVLGDLDAAATFTERALALPPAEGPNGGLTPTFAGYVRLEAGDAKGALPLLEEGVERTGDEAISIAIWWRPIAEYALAVALDRTGGDSARAEALAQRAVEDGAAVAPLGIDAGALAQTWLSKRAD